MISRRGQGWSGTRSHYHVWSLLRALMHWLIWMTWMNWQVRSLTEIRFWLAWKPKNVTSPWITAHFGLNRNWPSSLRRTVTLKFVHVCIRLVQYLQYLHCRLHDAHINFNTSVQALWGILVDGFSVIGHWAVPLGSLLALRSLTCLSSSKQMQFYRAGKRRGACGFDQTRKVRGSIKDILGLGYS